VRSIVKIRASRITRSGVFQGSKRGPTWKGEKKARAGLKNQKGVNGREKGLILLKEHNPGGDAGEEEVLGRQTAERGRRSDSVGRDRKRIRGGNRVGSSIKGVFW